MTAGVLGIGAIGDDAIVTGGFAFTANAMASTMHAVPGLGASRPAGGVASDFGARFNQQLGEANDKLVNADHLVRKLALGEADNLHQVMMALDDAKFSFNLLVQVRNKLLDAYQDVMRMQV